MGGGKDEGGKKEAGRREIGKEEEGTGRGKEGTREGGRGEEERRKEARKEEAERREGGRREGGRGKEEGGRRAVDQQDGEVGEVVAVADNGALPVRGLAAFPAPAACAARACRRAAVRGWHSSQGTGTSRGCGALPGLHGRRTGDAFGVAPSWHCPCPGCGHAYRLRASRRHRWHWRHPGGKGTEGESWGPSLLPGDPRNLLVPVQRGDTFSFPNSRGNAGAGNTPQLMPTLESCSPAPCRARTGSPRGG